MYTTNITINESQLDVHACWRLSSLLSCLQDAATADASTLAMGRADLTAQGAFWIVNRTSVWIDAPVGVGEYRLKTWHAACRGASWTRHYVLYREDTPMIRATSIWAAVTLAEPRKLVRLAAIDPFDGGVEVPLPVHVRMGEMMPAGQREIRYADLDQNAHLNNARAVDLALDALEYGREQGRFIREAHIHYAGESKRGDVLECFVGQTDNYTTFEARNDGKAAFDAAFCFGNL